MAAIRYWLTAPGSFERRALECDRRRRRHLGLDTVANVGVPLSVRSAAGPAAAEGIRVAEVRRRLREHLTPAMAERAVGRLDGLIEGAR